VAHALGHQVSLKRSQYHKIIYIYNTHFSGNEKY